MEPPPLPAFGLLPRPRGAGAVSGIASGKSVDGEAVFELPDSPDPDARTSPHAVALPSEGTGEGVHPLPAQGVPISPSPGASPTHLLGAGAVGGDTWWKSVDREAVLNLLQGVLA